MARFTHTGGGAGYRFASPIKGDWWSGARLSMLIIIANFAIWLILAIGELISSRAGTSLVSTIMPYIAISFESTLLKFRLYTLLTYIFVHFDFMHFFWNNLLILFFSPQIERDFGRQKFAIFYLVCGIGAAFISILYKYFAGVPSMTIGASGAVMGILVAYGMTYPNQTVYVFGIFPVKMKTLLIVIIVIQFAMTIQPGAGHTDYWAHLGGLLTGFLYMKLQGYSSRGPRPPKIRSKNWRGEDSGEERSYYLEV